MTETDIYLVVGILLCGLSIPSVFGAMADRRTPWAALIGVIAGAGLVAWAVNQAPGVYTFAEVPHAFVRVAARVLDIVR